MAPSLFKVKAILADYGRVLSQEQDPQLILSMAHLIGIELDSFKSSYWTHRSAYDRGLLDGSQFWQKSFPEKKFNSTELDQLISFDCLSWARINAKVYHWLVSQKKAGKKVGLLSNMPKELSQFLRRELPELSLFDPCLFSAQIGLIKPEAECYEVALKQLELAAEEVLFIDDSETNILAAANLSLQTLKFTHINQLLSLR